MIASSLNISYDRACILRSIYKAGVSGKNYSVNSARIKYLHQHGMIRCLDSNPSLRDYTVGAFVLTAKGKEWVEKHKHLKGPKDFSSNYA